MSRTPARVTQADIARAIRAIAQTGADLAVEIADTFIYLDLLAQSQGIDLETAVIDKFNRTSTKIGYDNKLFRRSA